MLVDIAFIRQRATMQLLCEVTDKTFFMFNSTEYEIYSAHKYRIITASDFLKQEKVFTFQHFSF